MNIRKCLHIPKLLFHSQYNYCTVKYWMTKSESRIIASMSTRDINRLTQKRKKLMRKNIEINHGPAQVTLQVLGSGMHGIPSCLYVSTDHAKYLFNCGEGTQRLAHEHHLRLTKLENVFFTTPTWKNIGGLPGMALTIQDMGVPDINLHGPTGIRDIFDAVKRFVWLEYLTVKETNCNENNYYMDSCMTVRYVHLKKSTADSDSDDNDIIIDDNTDYYAHEMNRNGKRNAIGQKLAEKKFEPQEVINQPRRGKIRGCIAYVCKLHPKLGALNLGKCVDKGVKPGPILGELKAGNDVTLENGTIIKSVDVCDPPMPGPVFIVIECPSEDYLDSLMENEIFKDYQKDATISHNVASFIVHFTPENIIKNPRYIEWMSRFSNDTEHLTINKNNNCHNFEALHRVQHQLNLLHPTIFPIIHDKIPEDELKQTPIKTDALKELKINRATVLDTIYLRPLEGLQNLNTMVIDRKADINEVFKIDGFLDELAELQTQINSRSKYINESPAYPKILMLGTGSSIPNKIRNTSGILVRIDEDTSVLLDCGEGTAGQLIRFFGPSEIDKVFASIKGVYVSHLHADHHLGLVGVLQERKRVTDEPIFLLAPKQIESWLNLYHNKFEHVNESYILVPNQCLHYNERRISMDAYNELKDKLQFDDVCTIDVYHCPHSFAVAFNLKCGKKIVYSGDTRPCPNIVTIGVDCDLLIHEATMEDRLLNEAKKKMHSTISEALDIGKKMNAKFTLLTHFSQRYSKMPCLPNTEEIPDNVGIAFDNMQFSLSELSLLPLFYPSLRLMFSDFCDTLEQKAQKRILREEMKKQWETSS